MFKAIVDWLSDNKKTTLSEISSDSLHKSDEPDILYGVNLNEWNYLGYTIAKWTTDGETSSECDVHFFENKDGIKRKWVMVGSDYTINRFRHHSFVERYCEMWRTGEMPHFEIVIDFPSDYMKHYMATKYSSPYKWNGRGKWTQDTVKMQQTATKNKKIKIIKENDAAANNVVTMDFGKKND